MFINVTSLREFGYYFVSLDLWMASLSAPTGTHLQMSEPEPQPYGDRCSAACRRGMFFTSLSACKELSHCSVVGCEKM